MLVDIHSKEKRESGAEMQPQALSLFVWIRSKQPDLEVG
jgi:hypothetical protein